MNCPKCKNYHLKPYKLDNGLLVLLCDNCQGTLLSIVQYIQWRELQPTINKINTICEIKETHELLHCPKCSGFMTKYHISNKTHNRLDLCFRCYETWIDSGEWQLLQQLDLHTNIENIFSEGWQNNVSNQHFKEMELKRIKTLFKDDFEEIERIKNWIYTHKQKQTIINYLQKEAKIQEYLNE